MAMSRRDLLTGGLSLAAGATIWGGLAAPVLAGPLDMPDWVEALAEARLWPWEGGPRDEIEAARRLNPEYDLMARTFLALALGDLALRDPSRWKDRAVRALDAMIADTTAAVESEGPKAFLLSYWGFGQTRGERRSVFVDGERLLVMLVRRWLSEDRALKSQSTELAEIVAANMAAGPVHSAESYPNECWTFCNTVGLGALRLQAVLDGDLYPGLRRDWLASAKAKLVEPDTGLLVSGFQYDGTPLDGPEGSTVWLVSHMLRLVDTELAADQYARARAQLGRTALGFGWAVEWPRGHRGHADVDSGPIVPFVDASPSSSGLAILAARSFGDERFSRALLASLKLAAAPREEEGRRRFLASNVVGDAVILAGCTVGPLWDAIGLEEA